MLEALFNKVTSLKAYSFIKKRLQHRCFALNIGKLLRTASFIEHLWWLLLKKTESCLSCVEWRFVIFSLFEMRMLRQKRNKSYLWLSNLIKRLLIIVYQLSLFTSEAVFRRYSAKKKLFLKISQNAQENSCLGLSVLIKLSCRSPACNFVKKDSPTQVFSFEFSNILK